MSTTSLAIDERLSPKVLNEEITALLEGEERHMAAALDLLLAQALLYRASDIHVEPYQGDLRVRFRVDGYFQDVVTLTGEVQEQFIARVKVMAGLVVHRRDLPQEGRIRSGASDFRVSIIPTVAGEKLAIRIFDVIGQVLELEDLGFLPDILDPLGDLLMRLSGAILLTGPSGSGKTTTLYAALRRIHDRCGDHAAITTIEDPVEYDMGLFAQMQVSPRTELTFASALTAVLRQDPRVIMLGEIRDPETCEIAMRAGLTGHLVLSTIHSGTACGVVTRLFDMGIEPYVASSSLKGIVAQRLARRNCPHCTEEYEPEPALRLLVRQILADYDGPFRRGAGCPSCLGTGYLGRLALTEMLIAERHLDLSWVAKLGTAAIEEDARGRGFSPLLEDGVRKVAAGMTTAEEVVRALGAEVVR